MSEFRLEEDLRRLDGPVTPDDRFSDELWSRLAGEFEETVSREPDRGRFGRGILVAAVAGIAVLAVIVPVVFFSGDGGGPVGSPGATELVEEWLDGALDGDFEGIARLTHGTAGEPEALDRLARRIHSYAEEYGPPTVAITPWEVEHTFDFTCVRLDFDEVVLVGGMVTLTWPDLGPRLWEFRTNMEGCLGFSVVTTTMPDLSGVVDERPSQSPSQSPDAAQRDGVVPDLARLPLEIRAETLAEAEAADGTWVLSRPSRELIDMSAADGCGFGDLGGTYPTEVICTVEYGEILLIDDNEQIVRAYPMPGAIPSWIHLTPAAVYAGRIGDGGLPNSTIVRIDRTTLQATVLVVPAESGGGTEWPPTWYTANPEQASLYDAAIGFAPDMTGTQVTSWIGDVVVDIEAIDQLTTVGTVNGPVLNSPVAVPGEVGRMAAEVTGVLHFDQATHCLSIEMEGVRYPVVWPAGTTWQEDPPAVALRDGETVEPGMTLYGAGGYLNRDHVEQLAGSTVADAAEACAGPTGEIAFFNIASEVDVIAGESG